MKVTKTEEEVFREINSMSHQMERLVYEIERIPSFGLGDQQDLDIQIGFHKRTSETLIKTLERFSLSRRRA